MTNKINFIMVLSILIALGSIAMAGEDMNMGGGENDGKNFAAHKAEMIANINKEKAVLDKMASCIQSAQNIEAIKKCHEIKKSAMNQMQSEMLQKRKQHLTEELKKIESKEANRAVKANQDNSK